MESASIDASCVVGVHFVCMTEGKIGANNVEEARSVNTGN
jgi:hypothetical protein